MKWIKKITNVILIVVLALGFSVGSLALTPPQQASALGVIGSNAVKSIVIGSMEKAGVTFTTKEAKDKAFDAWNMRAYNKWKEDEAAGRNADLWAQWHAFEQNPSSAMQPAPDAPDKPGVGKFLLNSTIFGMAIGIGADIGYAIQDHNTKNLQMAYYSSSSKPYEGVSYNTHLGLQKVYESSTGTFITLKTRTGYVIGAAGSPIKGDSAIYVHVTKFSVSADGSSFILTRQSAQRQDSGKLTVGDPQLMVVPKSEVGKTAVDQGVVYDMVPASADVPRIAPVPELAPLIAPSPDLAVIPEVLPPAVPVEVIIPSNPESDPFWDGEINDPYVPPTPGDNPDKDKPPGEDTDPDKDPDAPPGTDPDGDTDAPPGTDPDGDTDAPPGTDPGKDEETPPGKDEDQPPKEDEENSCDASLKKPDFKKVGVAFTHAFPFSLPWDLKRFFDAAFAGIGSEKPSVDLTFLGNGVTVTIPDYFDSWIAVLKNIMVIMFDISLIWMFARFMQRGGGD